MRSTIVMGCSIILFWTAQILRPTSVYSEDQDTRTQSAPGQTTSAAASGETKKSPYTIEKTAQGVKIVSSQKGNRYSFEITGQRIQALKTESPIWVVDGVVVQAVNVPLSNDPDDPRGTLVGHQKYETDFQVKQGWTTAPDADQWLAYPSGEPIRFWKLARNGKADPSNRSVGMLFATTLNGRNVVGLSATLFPEVDEAKAKDLLRKSILSLKQGEPSYMLIPGEASALFFNDEIATRKDRKSESAIVLSPQQMIIVTRIGVECHPQGAQMLSINDGHNGHMVNLWGFDRARKSFIYNDHFGATKTFLGEGNNLAGIKAIPYPEHSHLFLVTEPEMKKVIHCVFLEYDCFRPYACTGSFEKAVGEYRRLQKQSPKSNEIQEERLLLESEILADEGETVRAAYLNMVCCMLHDNSSRALAGIAAAYAKLGKAEPATNFYADAITKLPSDTSLNDERRHALAESWKAARSRIVANPPQPKK